MTDILINIVNVAGIIFFNPYNLFKTRLFVSSCITVKNLILVDLCFESQAQGGATTITGIKKGRQKKDNFLKLCKRLKLSKIY